MITLLTGIASSSAALTAERIRMEVISQNIANANTTRGLDGKPYQRQHVVFETALRQQLGGVGNPTLPQAVQVSRIEKDNRPARLIPDPSNPGAMQAVPDINIHEEMADYITASRSFEANLAVVKNARAMAMQTLSIGK